MAQILIAFPAGSMSEKIRQILLRHGYDQTEIVSGGGEALRSMGELNSGVLVCPTKLRDMDYLEALENLPPFWRILLIDTKQNIVSRREDDVIALDLPMSANDILETISMMVDELDYSLRQEKKRRRSVPKERSPEDKKKIDDAKALIMERNHLTEEEAFRYLQKNSMDTGRSFVETAEMILTFR